MKWSSKKRRAAREGFTLLESLLASVLLASVITTITMPFVASAQQTAQDARNTYALVMGQEMMEEIISLCNQPQMNVDQGPPSRPGFRTPLDYDGYEESAGNITDQRGLVMNDPLATGLTRHVSVESFTVDDQRPEDVDAFLRVRVTIRHHGVSMVSLTRLVFTRFAEL